MKLNRQLSIAVAQMQRLQGGSLAGAGMIGAPKTGMTWNQYQAANAGRGLTPQQMSAGYQAQKTAPMRNIQPGATRGMGRFAAPAALLGGLGLMGMSSQATPGSSMSVLGDMASGALMGSMFGLPGAAIGAGLGAIYSGYKAVTMNAGKVAPRSGGRRNTMAMGQPVSMHEKDQIVYAGRHIFPDAGTRKKENKKMAEEIAKPIVAALKEVVTAMQNQPPIQLDGKMIAQNTDRRLFTGPTAKYNQFSTSNTLMSS